VAFGAAAFGVVAVGVIAIEVAAMTAVWVAGGRVGIAGAIGVAGAAVIAVAIAGGNVAVGLAVGRPTEHPAEPIVLVSIVTAPFQASARAGHASAGGQADAPEREEGDDSRLY
jgi:hypothetical protein